MYEESTSTYVSTGEYERDQRDGVRFIVTEKNKTARGIFSEMYRAFLFKLILLFEKRHKFSRGK